MLLDAADWSKNHADRERLKTEKASAPSLSSVSVIIKSFDRCLVAIEAYATFLSNERENTNRALTLLLLAHSYAFEFNSPPVGSCAHALHLCAWRTERCCSLSKTGHSVSCSISSDDQHHCSSIYDFQTSK